MALSRVQATGRVTGTPAAASVALTFPVPPAVGNGLIVEVIAWRSGGFTFSPTGCADNRGHGAYPQAVTQANGNVAAAIYFLPLVATSAAPFTITVTPGGGTNLFEAAALEVSGVYAGLAVDQTAKQASSTSTPSTGASPAVTAAEVFVAAVVTMATNQASLVAQVLTPPWVEEFENLNHSATVGGEGDSRVRPGALGTTQTASWTGSALTLCAAVLAAFKAVGAPTGGEQTQPYVWGPL